MLTISADLLSAVSGRVYYSGQFGFNTVLTLLAFGTFPQRDLARASPESPRRNLELSQRLAVNDYKPKSGIHRTLVMLASTAVLLAGCATSNPGPQSDESFKQSMSEAEAALASGQREQAINLFEQIAKNNPTREEPWSRMAQIEFGAEHYPQAIVAAEEALQRDATDRKAKSVLAVSGLRVARRSLQELRADSALAGDVRSDAQLLAQMLRDTLGEQVLFPRDKNAAPAAKPVPRRRAAPAKPTAAAAQPAQPAAAGGGSADPFGALR